MPFGNIRTGIVAAFAVMFGIVQILCACMDLPSAQMTEPAQIVHQMSMGMSAHDHHGMMDAEQSPATHDHGEHDHEVDCSHCDDTAVLLVSAELSPSVFTTPAKYKTAYFDKTPHTRADMAATNLSALRWLDPPRRAYGQSPVTLHTRSLI